MRRNAALLCASMSWLGLLACQSTANSVSASQDEPLAISDEPVSAEPGAVAGGLEAPAPDPEPAPSLDKGERYTLGPLLDEGIQEAVYKGLQKTVEERKSLGNGAEEKTELGEQSNFTFNIVKLLQGNDDISGDGGAADSMDVEVTGWYKRTMANQSDHGDSAACTSFDALVTVKKQGDAWQLTPGESPTFGREDSEDCF